MNFLQGSYSQTEGLNPDDIEIGKYTGIAARCTVHGPDNHTTAINHKYVANCVPRDGKSKGKIVIGNDVWIGTDVVLLNGVKIGDGAIIGANTVVSKDIPDYAVAVGNPVVDKRMRFTDNQILALKRIAWWNWTEEKVNKALNDGDFDDIKKFLEKYA